MKNLSKLDQFICEIDLGIRTLAGAHQAQRETPSAKYSNLDETEQKHSAGLMRVNHCGEVCAQALYQGQALTAKNRQTQQSMQHAAEEEIDHLVWCEQRLTELNSKPSLLNPLWYTLSFSMGAITGLLGDKISLGFVAATEEQVCHHLEEHLEKLPENDDSSRAILEQMLIDERAHGEHAIAEGGHDFPAAVKSAMTHLSKLMTKTSYHI